MTGGSSIDIMRKAQEQGMLTVRESGLEKVKVGETTLDEINRVTKD